MKKLLNVLLAAVCIAIVILLCIIINFFAFRDTDYLGYVNCSDQVCLYSTDEGWPASDTFLLYYSGNDTISLRAIDLIDTEDQLLMPETYKGKQLYLIPEPVKRISGWLSVDYTYLMECKDTIVNLSSGSDCISIPTIYNGLYNIRYNPVYYSSTISSFLHSIPPLSFWGEYYHILRRFTRERYYSQKQFSIDRDYHNDIILKGDIIMYHPKSHPELQLIYEKEGFKEWPTIIQYPVLFLDNRRLPETIIFEDNTQFVSNYSGRSPLKLRNFRLLPHKSGYLLVAGKYRTSSQINEINLDSLCVAADLAIKEALNN